MSNDKLNWAVLAPKSRLFKGRSLYRWEVSPGLDHHCGVCATPLHNARAKTTCLGKHVEPCYRFHQQLHFIGKSHECFGCSTSNEMHHNRHKEILKIVRQINVIDSGFANSSGPLLNVNKGHSSGGTSTPTDASSEVGSTLDVRPTRRERKKAKKVGKIAVKNKIESFSNDELNFISEAIHLTKHTSKGAWAAKTNYCEPQEALSTEMVKLDPDPHDEELQADELTVKHYPTMTPRQRKIAKIYSSPVSGHFRGGRKFMPNTTDDLVAGIDPKILYRLGIEVAGNSGTTKERKELVSKLITAIKEDLDILDREDKESAMREEGFLRWAGKSAVDIIARAHEDIDWTNGQKIEKEIQDKRNSSCPSTSKYKDQVAQSEAQSITTAARSPRPQYNLPITPTTKHLEMRKLVKVIPAVKSPMPETKSSSIGSHNSFAQLEHSTAAGRLCVSIPPRPSAWTSTHPLSSECESRPQRSVDVDKKYNKENENDAGWTLVTRGRGSRT